MIDSTSGSPLTAQALEQIRVLPDGAVSVTTDGTSLVLRASTQLQNRFEELLERRKSGALSDDEEREYQAMCQLDTALSWLNRLTRSTTQA